MFQTIDPFLQSELDYRRERLRAVASRKGRHPRFPGARRRTATDPSVR